MSYELYVNDHTYKARLHEEDCPWGPGSDGGKNGYVRYFDDYDEAWEWMENNLDGYDYDDCGHCQPGD